MAQRNVREPSRPPLLAAVDDDPEIRYTLQAIGRYAGWHMVAFPDGKTAMWWLHRRRPDALLIDYHLPDHNGVELTRAVRRIYPTIPIVVLTVDERQELADEFAKAGATDFALKPIRAPDLLARLRVHLNAARRAVAWSQEVAEASVTGQPESPPVVDLGRLGLDAENLPKGVQRPTLEAVIRVLDLLPQGATTHDVATYAGLGPVTAHRYLRFLEQRGAVSVVLDYQAVGRPRKVYRICPRGAGAPRCSRP